MGVLSRRRGSHHEWRPRWRQRVSIVILFVGLVSFYVYYLNIHLSMGDDDPGVAPQSAAIKPNKAQTGMHSDRSAARMSDLLPILHPSLLLSDQVTSGRNDRLSRLLLCHRDGLFPNHSTAMLANWTTEQCLDDDIARVRSVSDLMADETLWVSCASRVDHTVLHLNRRVSKLSFSCPSYPKPHDSSVLLKVPLPHSYDTNIYHALVIGDGGRSFWCILDAASRFAMEAQETETKWRLEFLVDPGKPASDYVRRLFQLLSSNNDQVSDDATPYRLKGRLGRNKQGQLGRNEMLSDFRVFQPNTRVNQGLVDTAARVRQLVLARNDSLPPPDIGPFVLLILRSERRLAGAETGTATEIVLALLQRSLPVYVVDLSDASVTEQIMLFGSATVVIGMHGAGLTNLVWMQSNEKSAVIEVAASYGWGYHVDDNGNCVESPVRNRHYMKADYYNLARRFGVRHLFVHPVYATPPPSSVDSNPIHKDVFYVDADGLAATAEKALREISG